jgi:hypothetical protein
MVVLGDAKATLTALNQLVKQAMARAQARGAVPP